MNTAKTLPTSPMARPPVTGAVAASARPAFETVYAEHFDFVWLSLRRLGVAPSALDDAAQDVFIVVHRKLHEFEPRAKLKTWLFAIALRIAHSYRRKPSAGEAPLDPERLASRSPTPDEASAEAQALRVMDEILATMDDERRAVFILVELEQLPVTEIAEALNLNLNTAYSRLRLAREHFNVEVKRRLAREPRGAA